MRYKPYTEAEIQSMHVMDEGIYPFEVLDVITTDKNNNPLRDKNNVDMAKLKLLTWDKENKERAIYTYISGDGPFAYKLRHFAKTIGMIDDYDQGIFNINRSMGKSGMAHIVIKKGTMKADGTGELWPDRNDIKDFVVDAAPKLSEQKTEQHPQFSDLNDPIPF